MVTLKAHILPHHDLQPPGCRGSLGGMVQSAKNRRESSPNAGGEQSPESSPPALCALTG
ncbi:TPA: hypothetical protein ACUNAC_004343 [Escherichia coli]